MHRRRGSYPCRLALVAVLLSLSMAGFAQLLETGAEVQGWNYQGDLVPYRAPHLPVTRPGLGLFVRANPHNNLSVKLAFSNGSVEGSDKNFKERATRNNPLLAFRTDLTFLSLHGEFHFLGRERRSIRVFDEGGNRVAFSDLVPDGSVLYQDDEGNPLPYKLLLWRQASPYISLGMGALFFNPRIVRTQKNLGAGQVALRRETGVARLDAGDSLARGNGEDLASWRAWRQRTPRDVP